VRARRCLLQGTSYLLTHLLATVRVPASPEVETADTKQKFEQTFSENMGAKSKPKVRGLEMRLAPSPSLAPI
jgi:hypothetical protein